jgi:hypothetical protein
MGFGRLATSLALVAVLVARAGAADGDPAPTVANPPPAAGAPPGPAPEAVPTAPAADAPPPAAAAAEPVMEAPPGRRVEYADDTLSVHLHQVALSEVIDEIARQAGATVKGSVKNPRDVSAEFDKVPIADALTRLLGGDQNFALVYGESGKLRTLRLLGGGDGSSRASGAMRLPATPTAAGVQPPTPASLAEVLARSHPIPLSGRLAQALGSQAQLSEIVNAGLKNEDPSVRAEAVQTAVRSIENDTEMRSAVMGTLQAMDDGQLATMVRGMAGDHGEEFLIQFAGHARHSDLRTKTQQILQQYRLQPPQQPGG